MLWPGDSPVDVAAVSLDGDLADRGIQKVDLLKIDAEGAEPLVLSGATRLLENASCPCIVVEVNPATLRSANSEPADVLGILEANRYQCQELERFMDKGEPGFECSGDSGVRTSQVRCRG